MWTELFISLRYLRTKRKERFISLISVISILGIAIGVTALIVVLAVMTGFDKDLHAKIVGNYSDITITGYKPLEAKEAEELAAAVRKNPRVKGVSPYVQGQVLLKEGSRFFAVGFKGIVPKSEPQVTRVAQYLTQGSLEDLGTGGIILGRELAAYFGFKTGSSVTVIAPSGKQHTLTVKGIFSSGMYDYDMNLVFVGASTAQEILGQPGQYTAVAVKLDDMYKAQEVEKQLGESLRYQYSLRTWMEANQNFFAALKLEKLTMFIILTLIIVVASFNIVSTLIVLVVDKTKDIGILRALGMTAKGIRRVFVLQGLMIGGLGVGCGVAAGLGLCFLIKRYQFIKLPQDIYYIDRLPVAVVWWPDMILIILAAFLITLAATIYPAVKASGLKPVEALRYE